MIAIGSAFFDTAIGRSGIAWSERGLVGVQLPESSDADTRARIVARYPDACETVPPPCVQRAIDDIVALLGGEGVDLTSITLDFDAVSAFDRQVYDVARAIPPGATESYGAIAARLGTPGAARSVGQSLGRNPFPIVVPCHRVVAAAGKLGGFSASGGVLTKRRLLAIESRTAQQGTLFL